MVRILNLTNAATLTITKAYNQVGEVTGLDIVQDGNAKMSIDFDFPLEDYSIRDEEHNLVVNIENQFDVNAPIILQLGTRVSVRLVSDFLRDDWDEDDAELCIINSGILTTTVQLTPAMEEMLEEIEGDDLTPDSYCNTDAILAIQQANQQLMSIVDEHPEYVKEQQRR